MLTLVEIHAIMNVKELSSKRFHYNIGNSITLHSIRNHTDNSSSFFHNVVAFLIYQGGVLFERI